MSRNFLDAAFTAKLFDFVITKTDVLKSREGLSAAINFGDWKMCYSPLTPLTTHSFSKNVEFYFLGSVFELDLLIPRNSIGHYLGVEYNTESRTLRLFRSRNSFLGVYYTASQKVPLFWGNFSRTKQLVKPAIDADKIEMFFADGLISEGGTLFSGIHQLRFQKQALIKEDSVFEESEPLLKSDSPENLSAGQFLDFTMARFSEWFKYTPYNSMALSGGADSRLLFATLQKYPQEKEFFLHSRCHPQMDPEQDADVVIAKRAADIIGKKHCIQFSQGLPSAYLSQEPPAVPPVLSGLYGGELLGGEVLNLISKTRLQKESEYSFAQALSACAQMFVCDFYAGAWSVCSSHHNLTLTPFWDSYVVAALLQTPTSVIKEYSLLSKMYEHLPSPLRELPFVSILTDYQPQWKKPLPGANPKSLKGKTMDLVFPSSWLRHKKQLSDEVYNRRAVTLWFYFKAFYGMADEELLSYL